MIKIGWLWVDLDESEKFALMRDGRLGDGRRVIAACIKQKIRAGEKRGEQEQEL